jgi:dCMP deaminase
MLDCNQLYIFLYPSSYVVHAEVNAILNTNHASAAGQVWLFQSRIPLYISFNFYKNFTGFLCFFSQKLYVTMFPCNECAKIIIQVCPFVGS